MWSALFSLFSLIISVCAFVSSFRDVLRAKFNRVFRPSGYHHPRCNRQPPSQFRRRHTGCHRQECPLDDPNIVSIRAYSGRRLPRFRARPRVNRPNGIVDQHGEGVAPAEEREEIVIRDDSSNGGGDLAGGPQ